MPGRGEPGCDVRRRGMAVVLVLGDIQRVGAARLAPALPDGLTADAAGSRPIARQRRRATRNTCIAWTANFCCCYQCAIVPASICVGERFWLHRRFGEG